MDLKKTLTVYSRLARLAVNKLCFARPKSEFDEHLATQVSNNVSQDWLYGWFLAVSFICL